MLDYPAWKEKEKPWQTLLSLITDIYSRYKQVIIGNQILPYSSRMFISKEHDIPLHILYVSLSALDKYSVVHVVE